MTVLTLSPPTTHLPPIGEIQAYSTEDLTKAIRYLRLIYNPDVRGIRRIDRHRTPSPEHAKILESHTGICDPAPTSSHIQTISTDPGLEALRSDAFERSYAIRWLTVLVLQAYQLVECADVMEHAGMSGLEVLLQQASSLLAICAGTASAGTITRTFRFQSQEAAIEVQLTDIPLENQDYASVGAQTWGSACLLSETLVERPALFGFPLRDGLRVLELGAGTGLVSVTLGKVLQAQGNKACSIVATDFHPSVLVNLQHNIEANFTACSLVAVNAHSLDWSKFPALPDTPTPFREPFDLILGTDIIYEAEHARWIKACVEKLLRRHLFDRIGRQPSPTFHLIIPLRRTHVLESCTVEEVFPLVEAVGARPQEDCVLAIMSKDVIVCEASGGVRSGTGAAEQVEYVHYIIGWVACV